MRTKITAFGATRASCLEKLAVRSAERSDGFQATHDPGVRSSASSRRGLRTAVPATGRAKSAIAAPRERKPVTPKVAVRLGKLFGDGPGPRVPMQAPHATWHAAREVDTSRIPTLDAA